MGKVGEGKNPTHQLKKLDTTAIREFRDRFAIPVSDDKLEDVPYFKPGEESAEMKYLQERRRALNGYLPQRRRTADEKIAVPALDIFAPVLEPTAEGREISTTQAFVRSLNQLVRDKTIGPRVVPIIPDEARTFGMDEAAHFADLGVAYGAPKIDLEKLRAHKDKVVGKLTGGLAAMAKLRKVTVVRGLGSFVGPNHLEVELTEGDSQQKTGQKQLVRFASAIIAAGSAAVRLPFLPDDPRVVDSTGALELRQVPKRMHVTDAGHPDQRRRAQSHAWVHNIVAVFRQRYQCDLDCATLERLQQVRCAIGVDL